MKLEKNQWIIPVVLGFVVMAGIGIVVYTTKNRIDPRLASEAKMYGVDPAHLQDLNNIDTKLFAKKGITLDEWNRYKSYALGSDVALRRKIARHLSVTIGTPYEQEAHKMAIDFANNSDAFTRANSLLSLYGFNDPSKEEAAKKMLADPDPLPRKMAASMLRQHRGR